MENIEQQIKKNGLKSGVILGLVLLALGIFSFYFITVIATSYWLVVFGPIILSVIVPIIIITLFCSLARKKIGGYWTFKQAATGIFIMFFVAYAVQMVGRDLIFAKLIEPNMVQKTGDAMMNATTVMLESTHQDQTTIDNKIAEIQKQFDAEKNVGPGKTIEGIVISIILIFAVALVFAAIFKKEPLRFDAVA